MNLLSAKPFFFRVRHLIIFRTLTLFFDVFFRINERKGEK